MSSRQYNNSETRTVLGNKPYFKSSIRPSRSVSPNDSDRLQNSNRNCVNRHAHQPKGAESNESCKVPGEWIPYTLRHSFLAMLSFISASLCLITFILWWRSSTNYGLGPDDGSSALLFGWRYTPTMISVIYVQLTAMLFDDVERTEPFARLARPDGADASSSVLHSPGPWWVSLHDGFAKKKHGSRSWTLICAALVNILGFLAISTLSSAYLYSEDVIVPQSTGSSLPIEADRTTHFRTIANLLQNVSTSPWITDEYTILPIWPTGLEEEPINTLPTDSSQKWQGETTMFKTELTCTQMKVEAERTGQFVIQKGYGASDAVSIIWSSPNGCEYGLVASMDLFTEGGGSWSNASTFFEGEDVLFTSEHFSLSNSTAECDGHEIIVVTEPWTNTSGSYVAQLCETRYYMANITVSIELDGDEPEISFDERAFNQNKLIIPDTLVNTTHFQDLVLNADWTTYMISILWDTAVMGGAAVLLGALYDYNTTKLVNDPNLVSSAAKAKQRYFGETLQASLRQQDASQKMSMQGTVRAVQARVVVETGAAIALGVLFAVSFILVVVVWWRSRLRYRPLNLKKDPATSTGVACLISQSPRTRYEFRYLRQPSTNDMQSKLKGEIFYTDSQGISRVNHNNLANHDSTQSENGTPKLLRLPALIGLVISLIAVVVGLAVLYHYAEGSDLYAKAFVYQFDLNFMRSSMSSIAPFSMIPTVVAVGLGLWWSAIDDNFRRLQPYLGMTRHSLPIRSGVDLSYQSSYWFWAAGKAAFHRHWLLFIVTLGSTISPVFTTAMSAVFDRGTGTIAQPITLQRSLEIRSIPHVFSTLQSLYPQNSNDYTATILANLYEDISSYWMYTATIQLAMNGSEPAWSKDGWSFVPLDLDSISANTSLSKLGASQADDLGSSSQTNVTFNTPAIRGRIECSHAPLQALANVSNWLTTTDLTNHTIWNKTTIPSGLQGGYQLGSTYQNRQYPGTITPLVSGQNWTSCPGCTSVFVNPSSIVCCGNGTADGGSVGVGYWSPNVNLDLWSPRAWQDNFTAKWFYGDAYTGIKANPYQGTPDIGLLFPAPPSLSILNCKPVVETADARVTVNPSNGNILSFNITSTPETAPDAFADNYLPHNKTEIRMRDGYMYYNVTLSYGRLFTSTMLTAADTAHIGGAGHVIGYTTEDLDDNTYNIRDEMNGLNMDFMTYSIFSMAGKDPKALLDAETFKNLTEKTFTTFFQHFVSSNVSLETGGWAYQKINASLPSSLGPGLELVGNYLPGTKASKYQDVMHPISHTNRTATAHVTQRVELLQMNAVAVWLSIGIMGWLIITTAVVAVLQKRYFGSLVRNVESLGDVLVLIAGSANLLQVVREIQSGRLRPDDYKHLRTRLGWFIDEDGGLRWGIEMEESFAEGPGVNWVSEPQFSKEKGGTRTWTIHEVESP
ncbi:uncharacterized protein N7477_000672 [Penicillium maclennaniae]|uniref:uncharacterized protein n=1 Tax=Penicillium maclennaniae TaxID=1343394 RepID=UPI0025423B1F|nr:uncharacterized protein N7477_000672 [Penicillium maclennaniae]KAJ5684327.1 hypothetical protein N7477_000672 [Penicillium maclennaniae]